MPIFDHNPLEYLKMTVEEYDTVKSKLKLPVNDKTCLLKKKQNLSSLLISFSQMHN